MSGPPALGFGRDRRIRTRPEFLALQQGGGRVHTAHFLLIVGRGPDPSRPARLGVTVTRKIGDAVRRNRVKRVVREAFRLDPALLPVGVDLLVIAKSGAPTLGLAEVRAEWSAVRPLLERRARAVLAQRPSPGAPPLTKPAPMTTKPG